MLAYPAIFTPDAEAGGFVVTFADVPGVTEGDTFDEAMLRAVDCLETSLSWYIDHREPLPAPSAPQPGQVMVLLSALGMAKVGLYNAMRERGVGKAELARRLNCHLPQIDRLLDLCHASKMEQLETALAALGKRLVIEVQDAA